MRGRIFLDNCFVQVIFVCVLTLTLAADGDHLRPKRAVSLYWYRCQSKPPQCQDKFEILQNHTMCIRPIHHRYNKTVQTLIEDLHNNVRQNVNPAASNMMKMSNINTLELEAQLWAENCQLHHDDPNKRFIPGRYHVGQNILVSPGKSLSWAEVIDRWANENSTFKYNQPGNDVNNIGNYAQMVWSESLLVGCGSAKCGSKYFYVCNYAPSMNVSRLDTPYEAVAAGQIAGQKCGGHHPSSTLTSLCDCSGKYCTNGGKLDLTTCTCRCVTGVRDYDTDICDLTCTSNGDHPSCSSKTKQSCVTDQETSFQCPWLCDVCPFAGKTYRPGSIPMPWETTTRSHVTTAAGHVTTAPNPQRGSSSTMAGSVVVMAFAFIVGFKWTLM